MTTTTDKSILTFADAIAAIDGKGSKGGWYSGPCPAHTDNKPSLGIKELLHGTFSIKCQAGCTRQQVLAALEQKTGKTAHAKKKKETRTPAERGITLAQYAELKKLPVSYLSSFRTNESSYEGKPAVVHTYFDEATGVTHLAGAVAGKKYRLSADSHDTLWVDHIKSVPYGLAHLSWFKFTNGQPVDWIVICEGESDTQTLYFNGICALGISGKNGWKEEFAALPQLADVQRVYIVQEPDAESFVETVATSFPSKRVYALQFQEPIKDPSAVWLQNPDVDAFWESWQKILDNAVMLHDGFQYTDTGNAERLVAKHGPNFRWLTDDESFCCWDGALWRRNKSGEILLPITKDVVRAIPNAKWRDTSESSGKRHAMIDMSKGETQVLTESKLFDQHPMLLNVQNGTLDLETGNLRDFERNDYLTKQAQVQYEPLAECPKFDAFLDYIFEGDKDTIHFMLKGLGYTLTGSVGESCFFICYGLGANGKTTLIETLMQILGPAFARPAKFSTFVTSKMYDQKYELATFKGARLITAVEPRKAGRLDEEVLKQITGGDQIMARDIYQANIVYYPEFKLWLAMNNQPRIVGTDDGIWRRVRLIPFKVKIPDSMKVKEFHKVLYAEEGSGILNRLLEGCRAWQEEGNLEMSGAVKQATTEFRAAQNVIQGFFDTHTLVGKPNQCAKASDLYASYKAWAEEQNEYPVRSNEFAEELERRNFKWRRTHDGKQWFGITLKAAPTETAEGALSFEE